VFQHIPRLKNMNPVEIEQALSDFIEEPFDAIEFAFTFLACFGRKPNELKSLRAGTTNKSGTEHAVLLRNTIHICVCPHGEVSKHLDMLREAPETTKWKAKLTLSTDGQSVEAENVITGETFACDYRDLADHFGFLLGLAGIATTAEIRNSAIDIKATGRLNRLYIELLKHNEDWGTAERRHDLNQFMTRLIFCFFAEDTGIFPADDMFTQTVDRMSDSKSENTHSVISTLFQAMDLKREDRKKEGLPRWVSDFPYVNGALFAGTRDVPKFSRIARSYLIHAGNLNWKEINPDIFGSMIQAVADDEERGSVGMHYTSVPNILKVLNPLLLDSLREQLEEAGDNVRKLSNLKKRISKIRVFDPACGSGNFLVIAYKEMRKIEAEINRRRSETHLKSEIPVSNFRGIEIRDFPTEIARLALIIAEYQSDELYRSQKDALTDFLPLDSKNWIVNGNALRLDWLSICPPTKTKVEHKADDLFHDYQNQAPIDFENEGGETYICGNPPYAGKGKKTNLIQRDMKHVLARLTASAGYIDLAGCWFILAAQYLKNNSGSCAFVVTNSICQGQQLPQLWPLVLKDEVEIEFAHLSFKWRNNALNNAGVICVIIGLGNAKDTKKKIFDGDTVRQVKNINAYLLASENVYVFRRSDPLYKDLAEMITGSVINDGGNLLLDFSQKEILKTQLENIDIFRFYTSSQDFIRGNIRYVISIEDGDLDLVIGNKEIAKRLECIKELRLHSKKKETRDSLSKSPHRFQHRARQHKKFAVIVPRVSSESRHYLPAGVVAPNVIIADTCFALIDPPIWCLALIVSRMQLTWVATVCGKLKTDFRYSNSLGWNTFPVPALTEKNKLDLTLCAEEILLAREKHFPATIADLYKPEEMPENLRQAHEKNDETLERIYIGRRFKNDTERLEKLFELYTKMTTTAG
jgi:hypothetical protein